MMFAAVHSVSQPHASTTNVRRISAPRLVCVTSGWNCTPYQRRDSSAIPTIGTGVGRRGHREARRRRGDAVAVAHPDVELELRALRERRRRRRECRRAVLRAHPRLAFAEVRGRRRVAQRVEQLARRADRDARVAELAMMPRLDLAAELLRHRLHAVADAEDRHAGVEHLLRCVRRAGFDARLRAAREDDALRRELRDLRGIVVPRPDLAIHADLAHAARDELGVLRAEIEDEDLVGVDVVHSARVSS
jgi:hypothetical protein